MIRKSCFEKVNNYESSYLSSYPGEYSAAERYRYRTYKECFLKNGLKSESMGL